MIDDKKYIDCALFLKGYLNPYPNVKKTDWDEIYFIANQIKRYIEGVGYIKIGIKKGETDTLEL